MRLSKTITSLGLLLALLIPGSILTSKNQAITYAAEMAQGFSPQRYKDGTHYGTGVYFAPHKFTLYTEPKDSSPSLGTVEWNNKSGLNGLHITSAEGMPKNAYADKLFFCYYPELNIAMMAVAGENGDGWVEVIYDQQNQKTAWVKAKQESDAETPAKGNSSSASEAHLGVYQTWLEFMKYNAKNNGIYWLSGVVDYNRALRSKDEDTAKLISTTVIRKLKVRYVRGNWLLVEIQDFEMNAPIGWLRWRDDDGNLLIFPNLNGSTHPMTPSF